MWWESQSGLPASHGVHVASVHAGDTGEFKPEYFTPALAGLGDCSLREPRFLEDSVVSIVYQCRDKSEQGISAMLLDGCNVCESDLAFKSQL
jgi:hypothetical protein